MAAVRELAYLVVEASNLSDWERFAVDLLGMQVGQRDAGELRLRMDDRAYRWLVVAGPGDDVVATGFDVGTTEDLDEIVARIRQGGGTADDGGPDLARHRQVDRVVVTADPMGNRVELVVGPATATSPFSSAVLTGAFVTGAGGAGHEVMLSKGVDRATYLAFYVDVLGFRISDYIVEELAPGIVADLVFLHCNPRHHTLALGDMPHPKRMHHFMVEVRDLLDVGLAHDRCLRAGQPFEMTLGSHPNDGMVGFYVRTPSGFSVEYGWGGRLVDDATWQVQTLDRLSEWGHLPPAAEYAMLGRCVANDPTPTGGH